MAKINFKPSIKRFRAWDNVNKTFPFIGFDILGETTVFDLCKQYELKHALELEITQFTGLLDSAGREIYEGDILTNVGEYQQKFIVYEKEAAYCLFSLLGHWGSLNALLNLEPRFSKNIQVIGNIFENPNLI